MSGTAEDTEVRFLRAISERIPFELVAEAHVFPAIRQGGVESGLAVVAASQQEDASAGSASSPADRERHTVFTARYRLWLKGPDRGKWEFDVVAEADAPLATVEDVVRGVQRRAGDTVQPERYTSEGVRAIVDGTCPATIR